MDFKINKNFVVFKDTNVYNSISKKMHFELKCLFDVNFQNSRYVAHFSENMFQKDQFICDYIYEIDENDETVVYSTKKIYKGKYKKETKIYRFLLGVLINARLAMIENFNNEEPIIFKITLDRF
jgi:hypothetical protein